MRTIIAVLLLAAVSVSQNGLCSRSVGTTPGHACGTPATPTIGNTQDIWWAETERAFAPPVSSQWLYFGPEDPDYYQSWGACQYCSISGWNPQTLLTYRVLDSWTPTGQTCSIPLHTCTWPQSYAYTISIPNNPSLIGTVWYVGSIEAFGTTTLSNPEHRPEWDLALSIGQ